MKKLIGFFLVIVSFFIRQPLKGEPKEEQNNKNNREQKKKMKETKILLSRAEIAKKLEMLKQKPLPKNLSLGAECYEIAQRPDRIDYICPVCNQKTIYANGKFGHTLEEISAIRSIMKTLSQYSISLDERAFCKICSKEISEKSLCLNIPYAEDGKNVYRRCQIGRESIKLLYEFLQDKDCHVGNYGEETPLANYVEELKALLGLTEKK